MAVQVLLRFQEKSLGSEGNVSEVWAKSRKRFGPRALVLLNRL
jgi:hypothetical protein